MTGTDLTRIDAIDVRTAATVISEAGWDMSKVAILRTTSFRGCGYAPTTRLAETGSVGTGRLPTNNPLTVALTMAASCLRQSNSYLGGTVPAIAHKVRAAGRHQGHGRKARPAHIPHAPLRYEICRSRSRGLPGQTSPTRGSGFSFIKQQSLGSKSTELNTFQG